MDSRALPTGSGFVDPNFPNPNRSDDASIIIYGYLPGFTLCILGIVLFTIAFFAHLIQFIFYRLWSFSPLTFACLMEVIGYIFRSLSSRTDPYRVTFFVVQYFLIVTAPVLITASIYVCLTKIIAWAEAEGTSISRSRFLRKKFILWTFISIDVVTTIMQVAGAGMIGGATSSDKDPSTGNNVLLAGLAVQTAAFTVFLALLAIVTVLVFQNKPLVEKMRRAKTPFLAVLPIASLLVYIRTIFRLAETSQGVFGFLSSHEGYFAGLEFAPMVVAIWLLAIWHPGRWMSNAVVSQRKDATHESV